MNTLGIYIHIPFCAAKCGYCDFVSVPEDPGSPEGKAAMDTMVKALLRHIKEAAPSSGKERATVDTVYFGGGTPTLIGEKRLLTLLGVAQKRFRLARDAEITVECNPDFAGVKLLKTLRKGGVNRLSVGAQSLNDELLRILGRRHTAAGVEEAVQHARDAGFGNLSLDLMYGLPGQTPEQWAETLRRTVALKPEHISCYALTADCGRTVFAPTLPTDDMTADMYLNAVEVLTQNGYAQYEISNFAKPGYESHHNLRYWLMQDYLGFGPAAHSDYNGRRFHTANDPAEYAEAVLRGDEVIGQVERLLPEERAMEYIMLGLRLVGGISGNEYARRFRADFSAIERKLEKFAAHDLAERSGDRWRLTPKGFLVQNQIVGKLLET
jgi:oxygen-independent coproporphyrinogen-3 oxidase